MKKIGLDLRARQRIASHNSFKGHKFFCKMPVKFRRELFRCSDVFFWQQIRFQKLQVNLIFKRQMKLEFGGFIPVFSRATAIKTKKPVQDLLCAQASPQCMNTARRYSDKSGLISLIYFFQIKPDVLIRVVDDLFRQRSFQSENV